MIEQDNIYVTLHPAMLKPVIQQIYIRLKFFFCVFVGSKPLFTCDDDSLRAVDRHHVRFVSSLIRTDKDIFTVAYDICIVAYIPFIAS